MATQFVASNLCRRVVAPSSFRARPPPPPPASISPFPRSTASLRPISTAASADDATKSGGDSEDEDEELDARGEEGDAAFEERLAKLQRRVKSGSGTKAERRKARKAGDYVSASTAAVKGKVGDAVLLPPVPLRDPVSDGLRVELGFNTYTERINGRFAALGFAAVLLVELATGGSFLKYHESAVIGLQAYFMLAASALFIKYEKEKISVWPKS